jgi:hypothetical protein
MMKRVRKMVLPVVVLMMLAFFYPLLGNAQADPGCDPMEPGCPVDGGVLFLVAAGIGLGAKKIFKKEEDK